ncbi:MAG: glycosyltransferase family 39 protein [Niabella sp.]
MFFWNTRTQQAMKLTLLLGILFRLFFYAMNKSLWIDEVYLSSSIVNMPFADLLNKPLAYYQKAPLGFLLMQKLCYTLFGANEMALRVFPLLCGIASLFVFASACKYFLCRPAAWLAVVIMAFSPALIFHATEAKQYATELLAITIAIWAYTKYNRTNRIKDLVIWGVIGTVLCWFAYAVIFILVAMAMAVSLRLIIRKKWNLFFRHMIPFSLWAISFGTNYLLFTYKHAESVWTVYWFDFFKNFAPLFPKNLSDLAWYPVNFYRLFDYPLGMFWNFNHKETAPLLLKPLVLIPIISCIIGLLALWKRKQDFLFFTFAVALTLFASGLKLYPLTERFWVFLSPVFIICIAKGAEWAQGQLKRPLPVISLYAIILFAPLANTVVYTAKPDTFIIHKRSFHRQAMQFITSRYKPGDVVYVYWNHKPVYLLYQNTLSK